MMSDLEMNLKRGRIVNQIAMEDLNMGSNYEERDVKIWIRF